MEPFERDQPAGGRSLSEGRGAPALTPAFFARPAIVVARDLLGARIVSTLEGARCSCRIVETEAYVGPHDEASHAAARIGRTARNDVMYAAPGTAYVYRIYGVHWCLNAVTDAEGFPAAVLIRAAEPVDGLEFVRARRPGRDDRDLMRGPGNLCSALGITGGQNGHRLDSEPLRILPGEAIEDSRVAIGPRIGVSRAADLPLRFWVADSPFVSRRPRIPRNSLTSPASTRSSRTTDPSCR